jgi:hypothetical protein
LERVVHGEIPLNVNKVEENGKSVETKRLQGARSNTSTSACRPAVSVDPAFAVQQQRIAGLQRLAVGLQLAAHQVHIGLAPFAERQRRRLGVPSNRPA